MVNKKVDRRIMRTRQSLKDAYISLINEKEFSAISITDIVNRSNLNRSTFYAHFQDKEDLLSSMINELIDGTINSMLTTSDISLTNINEKVPFTNATIKLFTFVADHSIYFATMLNNKGVPQFNQGLSDSLYTFFLKEIDRHPEYKDQLIINKGFFSSYLTSTFIGFVYHWLITTNMKYTPDYIANEFTKILILKPFVPHLHPKVSL